MKFSREPSTRASLRGKTARFAIHGRVFERFPSEIDIADIKDLSCIHTHAVTRRLLRAFVAN